MNYNQKNYKDIEYVTQEEIDKMSYNEKFFPPCKCGKKGESRWIKCEENYHEGYDEGKRGMFYSITPFKGEMGKKFVINVLRASNAEARRLMEKGFENEKKLMITLAVNENWFIVVRSVLLEQKSLVCRKKNLKNFT